MTVYTGIVEEGSKRAAALGYPTINIRKEDSLSGVYAARVTLGGEEYHAAAFADPKRSLVEAHVLGFAAEWYGKEAEIELCKKLRESQRYESDEDLKQAIAADVAAVRQYFNL